MATYSTLPALNAEMKVYRGLEPARANQRGLIGQLKYPEQFLLAVHELLARVRNQEYLSEFIRWIENSISF